MLLTSTDTESPVKPMPYGAMRRPFNSTSVRSEVRPCSEIDEMLPVVAPEDAEVTLPPELEIAATVCISCSTLVAPDFRMSSRVITCTGKAVSASMRLIEEPVISTRCICCAS